MLHKLQAHQFGECLTQEELLDLLNIGENNEVEFKSAKGGLPKSLWESVSAFANTNGGRIILGVTESNGTFSFGSLKNAEKMVQEFWNVHNSSKKLSYPVCSENDVSIMSVESTNIIIIQVPIAHRNYRPIFLNGNPYIGTYKRRNEGDYRCIESEIKQMIRDSSDEPQDFGILDRFGLDDIDLETLQAYKNRFSVRHSDHPYLALNNKDFLMKLGGYRVDRKSKKDGLTMAGLLMFGKEMSILEVFPHFHLDYQEKMSTDKEKRWSHRITMDGTWECNLHNFYYRVYNRITQDIEIPFVLMNDGVRIGETHVHEAIREALVNSLVHANHESSKSITIIKTHDNFSFSNPGRLRIPIEQMYQGGISDVRNPYLQRMFQFVGLGEKAGSGFSKILRAWKEQNWLMPLVTENLDIEQTEVFLPLLSMVPEKVNKELSKLIGKQYKQLEELERLILILAYQFEAISNQGITKYTETHSKDIGEELKNMVEKQWLLPKGVGRGRTYALNRDFEKDTSLPIKEESLPHKNVYLPHKDLSLPHLSLVEQVKRTKRTSQNLMRQAILEACQDRFISAFEFSKILNRNVKNLRERYLWQMVKEGLLETKYSEANHPNQAYKKKVTE